MTNEIDSVFSSTFLGANVFITTNVSQTHRMQMPDGLLTETLPMFFEGVLMDIDDDYLYLGDGQNVSNAIKKQFVLQIELKEEDDKYRKLLESVNPRDENDLN